MSLKTELKWKTSTPPNSGFTKRLWATIAPYFWDQLRAINLDGDDYPRIDLPDLDPISFHHIIQYLYQGTISDGTYSLTQLLAVCEAATTLQLPKLVFAIQGLITSDDYGDNGFRGAVWGAVVEQLFQLDGGYNKDIKRHVTLKAKVALIEREDGRLPMAHMIFLPLLVR